MTDTELIRRLAERVMGWEVQPPDYIDHDGLWRWNEDRIYGPWQPLVDMNDAMLVVERMQDQDWQYEIGSCVEGHSAMFMCGMYDLYDGTWEEMHEVVADTPARAICLAALKTREEKPDA